MPIGDGFGRRTFLQIRRLTGKLNVAHAGFKTSRIVRTMSEVTEIRDLAHHGNGPVFAQVKIDPEALYFVLPPADGGILTTRFRQSVLGDGSLYN